MTVALSRQNLRKWIETAIRKFRSNDLLGVPEAWLKIYESLADYIGDERDVDTQLLWMMEGTNDSPADIIFQLQRLKEALTETAVKEKKLEELLPVMSWFDHTIVVLVEKASGQMSTKRSLLAPYETIFWNARDGMYISTIDGKFIHVNEALLSMLHFKRLEDLLEIDISTDLYEDNAARQIMLDHLMEDGFFDKHEFRFKCADGKVKTALESCFLVNSPSGSPFIAGVLVDVTHEREIQQKSQNYLKEIERQGIEANLKLSHASKRFESLANVSTHPIVVVGVQQFEILDTNLAFFKKFRYGKKHLETLTFRDLFSGEDWNKLYSLIANSLDRYHFMVRDLFCQNAFGEPFPVVLSIMVQRDELGPLLFVQIEDKTEANRLLRQRELTKQNLKTLIQAVPSTLIGFRNDGSVAMVSKHLLDTLGFSRRKMLNPSFINDLFTIEEQRLKFHKYLKQFLAGHHAVAVPVSLKNSKDMVLDFELSTVSFQFEDEEKLGCLAILKNVTDQNRLEQLVKRQDADPQSQDLVVAQLEAKNEQLERSQQDLLRQLSQKTTFISHLTHKFQEPIEVVLGYASLLKQSFDDTWKLDQKEDLLVINDHIQALLVTLETAREYALLESQEVVLAMEPHIVRQMLDELFDRLEPDTLPPTIQFEANHRILSVDWQIFTDIDILEALFLQVLRNAKSHTQKGIIAMTAYEDDGRLCIQITDTGKGIKPTDLPSIFEPFFPPNAMHLTTGMPHLGLGLAIVAGYTRLLGGECEIQSKPATGTQFSLWLPTA